MSKSIGVTRGLLQGGGSVGEITFEVLEMAFTDSADFILRLDEHGLIRFINQIFEVYGSPENVLGVPGSEFLLEESKPVFDEALSWTRENKKMKTIELNVVLGNCFQTKVIPIFSSDDFLGHLLVATDISSLKEANALLVERLELGAQDLAEEAEKSAFLESRLVESQRLESLGVLAGGIAHEYNNLLTVILGNAGLAQMLIPESSQAREVVRHLETATLHAAQLTNQLLTYSGRARIKTERLDLSQTISELAVLVSAVLKAGKSLELNCVEGVPPVLGDLGQLQQLLMHLVQQAADNMGSKEGKIQVQTGCALLDERGLSTCVIQDGVLPGEMVFLCVSDTGKQLNENQRRHFFEPFRLRPRGSHISGLSMAAVLGIVRSYGGTCRVDSSDKGNQVTLFFPVIAENDWNVEGSHCHVLLVEEQPTVRLSIGSFLKQRGYDVCSVESGHAALEYLNSDVQGPVAILLDVDMPSTNDFECFDAMRELRPGVPIVLMSWFSVDQIRKEFSERTVQDVLPKPLRLPELERIIRMNVGEP